MQLERGSEPLFSQIEARLAYEIVTGKLSGGTRLPSLRDAAAEWGVNLHTVRRAYRELASKGLVLTGAGGTRVASLGPAPASGTDLESRVRQFAREAREQFGVSASELARAFESLEQGEPAGTGTCVVVECSETLSASLAANLEDLFDISAEPLDLIRSPTLPVRTIVGTYFHAEELRSRMAGRTHDLYLVRIRPRVTLMAGFAREAGAGEIRRVVLLDRLQESAHDLAGDFQSFLGPEVHIEVRVLRDPLVAFPNEIEGTIIVATPQTWDRLPQHLRQRPDVRQLEYEFEPHDVRHLAAALDWRPRLGTRAAFANA